MTKLKVFLSYNHKDYETARSIQVALESIGIDAFLAHTSIEPSRQWLEEIHHNLKECDVFMPLLTENFRNSHWTDQEVGIAYAYDKKFIPIIFHIMPYGFMGKWQGHRFNMFERARDEEVAKVVLLLTKFFPDKIRESAIESISHDNINTYRQANRMFSILRGLQPFSNEQATQIIEKSMDNDQIIGATEAKPLLAKLLSDHGGKINASIAAKMQRRLDKDYIEATVSEMLEEQEKKPQLAKGLKDGL